MVLQELKVKLFRAFHTKNNFAIKALSPDVNDWNKAYSHIIFSQVVTDVLNSQMPHKTHHTISINPHSF